jgi:iron(III) transport system permease protein
VAVVVIAALVLLPLGFVVVGLLTPSVDVWRELWEGRLPDMIWSTVCLLVLVGVGTLVVGGGLAWLVTAYRFPGRRVLSWLLVLPLAMPGYVLGYVFISIVGFTGPVQSAWFDHFGEDAWFPPVRSVWGAATVLTLVLYPYVYLLARSAYRDTAATSYDVARSLGSTPFQAFRRVVLPLSRPALAAGLALVMMETLTDFATVQYFGVDTVSAGIYQVWRGMYDRDAAAELAGLVLLFALGIILLERALRGRAAYAETGAGGAGIEPRRLRGWRGAAATAVCLVVLGAAFVAPVVRLTTWALERGDEATRSWERYAGYLSNSAFLAVVTALLCVGLGVVVANALRFSGRRTTRVAARVSVVGYAVPAPVVAIGVLLLVVGLDHLLDVFDIAITGLLVTGSVFAVLYGYAVRFLALGVNSVEASLEKVPREITMSARTLGAGTARILRRLHMPLTRSGILTAAMLVAIEALKELPIVLLLRPFGFDTLSVWTWQLAAESLWEAASLPALTIIAASLVPVALLSHQLARGERDVESTLVPDPDVRHSHLGEPGPEPALPVQT